MLPRKQLVFNGFYCCSTHTNSETKHYFFFPASFRKLERHDTNEKKNCAQNIFHYVIFEHDAGGAKRAGVLNSQTTKQPNSQTTEVATAGKVPCIQHATTTTTSATTTTTTKGLT